MEKKFTSFQKSIIKNTYKNIYPIKQRIEKLRKDIEEIENNIIPLQKQIDKLNEVVIDITGYKADDLVFKSIEYDKDEEGNPIKFRTKYEFIYPSTIIPLEIPILNEEQNEPEPLD